MKEIAILGAGIGGMAAAYDLVRAGQKVVIYEASDSVGGLASGFKAPHWDWWVDKYYHHWFQTDRHILGLIDELGWSDRVLFPRPYTVMYYRGKFYPFDSILWATGFRPDLSWLMAKNSTVVMERQDRLPCDNRPSRPWRSVCWQGVSSCASGMPNRRGR